MDELPLIFGLASPPPSPKTTVINREQVESSAAFQGRKRKRSGKEQAGEPPHDATTLENAAEECKATVKNAIEQLAIVCEKLSNIQKAGPEETNAAKLEVALALHCQAVDEKRNYIRGILDRERYLDSEAIDQVAKGTAELKQLAANRDVVENDAAEAMLRVSNRKQKLIVQCKDIAEACKALVAKINVVSAGLASK